MRNKGQGSTVPEMDFANVSELSEEHLKSLREAVEQQIEARKDQRKRDVQAEYQRLADSIGMTPVQIVQDMVSHGKASKSNKAVAGVKYCNPNDLTQTWSGRGKRPNWLKSALAAGRRLEDFQI